MSSYFSPEVIRQLNEEKDQVLARLSSLWERFGLEVARHIEKPKAREYLAQGSCRRLGTIRRCLWNVFEIFPPDRETRLDQDELADIQLNLHASLLNAYGFFDNLAWVCVFERGVESKLKRTEIRIISISHERISS